MLVKRGGLHTCGFVCLPAGVEREIENRTEKSVQETALLSVRRYGANLRLRFSLGRKRVYIRLGYFRPCPSHPVFHVAAPFAFVPRCVLGNTTILAEFAGEEEVNRFLAQGQPLPPTSSWQSNTGTNQTRLGSSGSSHGLVRADAGHWNPPCLGSKGSSDLLWGGVPQYSSSLWGPPSADDGRVIGSPTPLNTLLPGDLLSGESI